MSNLQAIRNFERIKEYFSVASPYLDFCACGDVAVTIKPGPHTGNPFHLCAEHSALWTEQRLGIGAAGMKLKLIQASVEDSLKYDAPYQPDVTPVILFDRSPWQKFFAEVQRIMEQRRRRKAARR